MELTGKGNRHWQEFSSVTDILDFITNPKFKQADSLRSSGADPESYDHSREGFQEMLDKAVNGWPEGRDQIEKFVIEIEKNVMGYLPVEEVIRDVTGQWLDMGAFLSGEPECWGAYQDTDVWQEKRGPKIVHVVLNVDVTGRPFERGAAGVAIIDALERSGKRVIADAIANTVSRGRLLETRIRVKNSDEPVQLDKLAFLFAHRSILRHMLFACWERLPTPIRKMYGLEHSYGSIGEVPKEDQGDIYVERSAGYAGSIETVAKYVLQTIKEKGVNVSDQPAI